MAQNSEIRSFVLRTLKAFGAPAQEVSEELMMAQVTVEHPPFIFGPPRLETLNLNLVFKPEDTSKYPGAELVIPGSFRLNWMIDGIRHRGHITLGAIHYETNLRRWQREIQAMLPEDFPYFFFHKPQLFYRPFMLANFMISNQTDERSDYLFSTAIDMVSGEFWPELGLGLNGFSVSEQLPGDGLRDEEVHVIEAVTACATKAEEKAKEGETTWAAQAEERFYEELSYLRSYYSEDDENNGFHVRAEEIYKKFRPRMVLRWINLAILYLPEVNYTLQSLHGGALPTAVYFPVGSKLNLVENH